MPFEQQFLLGVAIPAAVASLVMATGAWRHWAWFGALGVAAGYFAGHLFIRGFLDHGPPVNAEDWLPILAVFATTVAYMDSARLLSKPARWRIGLTITFGTVLLLWADELEFLVDGIGHRMAISVDLDHGGDLVGG